MLSTQYIHYFSAPHFFGTFKSKPYDTHREAVSGLADMADGLQNIVIDQKHAEDVIRRDIQADIDDEELDEYMLDLEGDLTYLHTRDDVGPFTIHQHEIDEVRFEYEDKPGFFTNMIRRDITRNERSR